MRHDNWTEDYLHFFYVTYYTTSFVKIFWQCTQFRHLHNWLPFGKIMLGRWSRPLMTYQCSLKVLKYKILFVRLPAQRRHSQKRKFVLLCLIFDIALRIWRLSIIIIVLFVYPQCTGILFISLYFHVPINLKILTILRRIRKLCLCRACILIVIT